VALEYLFTEEKADSQLLIEGEALDDADEDDMKSI
jgi:hypothetical protein